MLSQLLLARVLLPLGFGDQDDSKRVAWATAMGLYSLPKSKRSYGASQPPELPTMNLPSLTFARRKNADLAILTSGNPKALILFRGTY